MNTKTAFASFTTATLLSFQAASAVYTVTTDSSATYDSPLPIESATVTVEDGETSVVKPFSEVAGAFVSGSVFRKRGEGYLLSSPAMKNFSGEIRIEEGGWMVVTNGCLGVPAKGSSPTVVISNDASLVVCPTEETCPSYVSGASGCLRMYNPMTFEGAGYENRGAIVIDSGVSMAENGFTGNWTLSGDAVIGMYTPSAAACTSMRYCYLRGHVLRFENKDDCGVIIMPQSFQAGGDTAKVIIDGSQCRMQDSGHEWWNGGSACELIMTNGAYMGYYNFDAEPKWTLVVHEGSTMSVSGTEKYHGSLGSTTYHDTWGGPVRLEGGLLKITGGADKRGARFLGTVSGSGGFFATDLYLQLYQPGNSFSGPVTVVKRNAYGDPGIAVYRNGALPATVPLLTVTNSPVYLGAAEDFDLPGIDAEVTDGTSRIYGLATEATLASLRKTGDGTLRVEVPFTVTGRTEIAAGTLVLPRRTNTTARLFSALPGLWRGISPDGGGAGKSDTVVYSNEVDGCFEMLSRKSYPPWIQNRPTIWGGYIWNRSPTNETWTFAVSVRAAGRVSIDGVGFDANDDYGAVRLDNKVMTPGPHLFRFAVNPRTYSSPGHGKPGTSKGYVWTDGLGIAIDRQGRKSQNYEAYEFPLNDMSVTNAFGAPVPGGDGSLFTRDNREAEEFSELEMALVKREAVFSELVFKPGAVVDLSGADDGVEDAPLVVGTVEGCGTVRNGSLKMAGKWTLAVSEKTHWPMKVDGDIGFVEGSVIDCDVDGLRQSSRGYVIALAGGKISGLPALSERLVSAGWFVCVDELDDCRLLLRSRRKSLLITVR